MKISGDCVMMNELLQNRCGAAVARTSPAHGTCRNRLQYDVCSTESKKAVERRRATAPSHLTLSLPASDASIPTWSHSFIATRSPDVSHWTTSPGCNSSFSHRPRRWLIPASLHFPGSFDPVAAVATCQPVSVGSPSRKARSGRVVAEREMCRVMCT